MIAIYNRVKELEIYAEENNIPIMERKGINFLMNYIKENDVSTILEIGTAIGYSAINMALVKSNIRIISIEKDQKRYLEAIKNIKNFGLEKQIYLILGDALDVSLDAKFDLIFIDAAKGQYIKFFEKFSTNLEENGSIITDNIYFHGLVLSEEEIKSKNLRGIVEKIRKYIAFLKNNKKFHTKFYKVGDGISVSKKRGE